MNRRLTKWKNLLTIYGPAIVVVIAGFYFAQHFVQPAPPESLTIAAGQKGGAYYAFALQYADFLASQGIELNIRETAGSMENIDLVNDGEVDLAFIQGGTFPDSGAAQIEALGSLYFEPLWLFHRKDLAVDRLSGLESHRVAVGASGSGTSALVSKLFAENDLDDSHLEILTPDNTEAVKLLRSGEIDAAFFVSRADANIIGELLHDENLAVASFERADAYASRLHFLSALTIPEGSVDLAANIPDRSIRLVAPAANLVANAQIHPAIVDLIMQGLTDIHYSGGILEEDGAFPSPRYLEGHLHERAGNYYKNGQPFLQRYLPFWAASVIDRLKVMLLPVVALLIPLLKIMPPLYQWQTNSGIRKLYQELDKLDVDVHQLQESSEHELKSLLVQLNKIDQQAFNLAVPVGLSDRLYQLREHIALVKSNLKAVLQSREASA